MKNTHKYKYRTQINALAICILVSMLFAFYVSIANSTDTDEFRVKPADIDAADAPNIILISLDTLRADHLGCYGYLVDSSPNIDSFCDDSVVFENTISPAPSTQPSHASIFTSMLPSHHGSMFAKQMPIPEDLTLMAESMKEAGYYTISFNDGAQVDAIWGFDQGFDEYTTLPGRAIKSKFINTINRAKQWLKHQHNKSFFMFLHTYEPHHPYTAKQEFVDAIGHTNSGALPREISKQILQQINDHQTSISDQDKEHITAMYDADVRSTDDAFSLLIHHLKRLKLYDNTMIIVTADHGEELGEHGFWGWHSHALFEEQLNVPLIIKFPKGKFAGQRISNVVRSIDILPTLTEFLNMPQLDQYEGKSLMNLIKGKNETITRPAVSQRDVPDAIYPVSLRMDNWKYYYRAQQSKILLFDIAKDPKEQNDLSQIHPKKIEEMKQLLEQLLEDGRQYEVEPVVISNELADQLKALGYIR